MNTRSADSVLALPEGWLIDDLTRLRMDRALASQSPDVAGIVARPGHPPSGASHRAHAERMATRAPADLRPTDEQRITGAVLLRPGHTFDLDGDDVIVGGGGLLVDQGAVVHNPWQPLGPTVHAHPDGRSPFPYRPVVLLLGTEHDSLLADWGRAVVNDLVRAEAEGRLAVPAPTEGLHLTVPSLPSEETVRAVAPDVIVALDSRALKMADVWLDAAGNRSTVTIELTLGTEAEPELLSWRIGEARGRLRARIGRGTKGGVLADLARRLATGPVPVGPTDRPPRPDGQHLLNPRRALARTPKGPPLSLIALVDPASPVPRRRWEALFGHIAPPAHTSVENLTGALPPGAAASDVLVVDAAAVDPAMVGPMVGLIAERQSAARITIVDVSDRRDLSPDLAGLVRRAGLSSTPNDLRRDQLLAELGVRALTLPTLLPQKRVEELLATGEAASSSTRLTIGLDARDSRAEIQATLRDALSGLLDRAPDIELRLLVSEPGPITDLLTRGAVTLATTPPRPHDQSGWLVSIVATDQPEDRPSLELVETQLVGVPVVCPAGHPAQVEGLVATSLVISDPTDGDEWSQHLDDLLHSPGVWERRSQEAVATASALYGPASAAALIDRFIGWLRSGGPR